MLRQQQQKEIFSCETPQPCVFVTTYTDVSDNWYRLVNPRGGGSSQPWLRGRSLANCEDLINLVKCRNTT